MGGSGGDSRFGGSECGWLGYVLDEWVWPTGGDKEVCRKIFREEEEEE